MDQTSSRSKLWRGFGIMSGGVLVWVIAVQAAMAPPSPRPSFGPKTTPEEIRASLDKLPSPGSIVTKMMIGYGLGGIVLVGGMVVTAMGLIEFAAEVRRREG